MNKINITELTIDCIKDVVEERDDECKLNFDHASTLVGPEAILDSLGLVTLLSDLEQKVDDTFNVSVILADEKAMSQLNSPFRTVATLAEYLWIKVDAAQNNG